MQELSTTTWLRRGSSVVFDPKALGPMINFGCLFSLRTVLSWLKDWPTSIPGDCRTILVGGLESYLELLPVDEAEDILRQRIKPLVLEFQARWDECGLVFGFGVAPQCFVVSAPNEEVEFVRPDQQRVRLSYALWDGTATLNVTRLVQDGEQSSQRRTIGYYVPRIS
jgi:hypothetical protein